jgi:hypothetical protein
MKKLLVAMLGLTILTGCTSEPAKPVQTEKPKLKTTEAVTGRAAFQKLYISARGWARDAQPYRLESQITADWKGKDGKSAIWRAYFASPNQRGVKPFIWSGSQAPDAPSPGITPGNEDTYNPTNSSTRVFDTAFIKLDSDKALEVAQKHGGDKILQKNPDNPIVYVLNWDGVTNELIWHVIYGDSPEDAKLRVAVNASNGEFLRVEK